MLLIFIVILLFLFIYKYLQPTVVMSICGNVEDVKRVKQVWNGKLVVYDKCGYCKGLQDCRILPNVGREQGTWVSYVLENYDNLPREIIFLPAPIDNAGRFERFKKIINGEIEKGSIIGPEEHFVLNEWKCSKLIPAEQRPFRTWFETNIAPWYSSFPAIHWNGIMKTTRENILQKPRKFYENLDRQLSVGKNTEVAHYMERSMGIVF